MKLFTYSHILASLALATALASDLVVHDVSNGASSLPTSNPSKTLGIQSEHEPFIPTHEWQPVLPGQAIPRGLHVQMDLGTGEKMAKLMDDTAVERQLVEPMDSSIDVDTFLENRLEGFFRKQHIALCSTLSSILHNAQQSSCDEAASQLANLADQVDDQDVATDVVRGGGLSAVLALVHPDTTCGSKIRAGAWLVVGSMAQNNHFIQQELLRSGAIHAAVSRLSELAASPAHALDETQLREMARLLYAMGAMARNNVDALDALAGLGGWRALLTAMASFAPGADSVALSGPATAVQRKLTTLVFDFVKQAQEEERAPIFAWRSVCPIVADYIIHSTDEDVVEQAANFILVARDECSSLIDTSAVRDALVSLMPSLHEGTTHGLADSNEFDDAYLSAAQLVNAFS